jgi:hypothetical protein
MSGSGPRVSDSRLLARALSGSWRAAPPKLDLTPEEFSIIAPALAGSGAGSLAWHSVSHSSLSDSEAAKELHDSFRIFKLKSRFQEQEIHKSFSLFRSRDIEPILIKGWAIARLYPDAGLRPYTDTDLIVKPEDYERAKNILAGPEGKSHGIDLHEGTAHLDEYPADEIYARSELAKLDDTEVRVLSAADHLRVLAVHWLHHGAFKPIGLCDIALAIESRPKNFDWDVCLGGGRKRARWIACAIKLAGEMLDANLEGAPSEVAKLKLPKWLLPSLLKIWETPSPIDNAVPDPLTRQLLHPIEFFKEAKKRWPPNPIQATILMNGSFNNAPRLPYQLGSYFARFTKFLTKLPKAVFNQQRI